MKILQQGFIAALLVAILISTVYSFGEKNVAISAEGQALLAVHQTLVNELFLYQDFLNENPEVHSALSDSGRDYPRTLQQKLLELVEKHFGARMRALTTDAESLKNPFEKNYILGLAYFDWFKIHFEIINDRRNALVYLDKANDYVKAATTSGVRFADIYRLYGEIQNQYIPMKGGFSAIYYSTQAKKNYQLALDVENNHAHSLLLLGLWNLFAPDIAGGSVPKAAALIRQARNSTHDRHMIFLTYVWEALAQSKAGRPADARAAIQNALALSPKNTWAKWILGEIDAGRRPLDSMI